MKRPKGSSYEGGVRVEFFVYTWFRYMCMYAGANNIRGEGKVCQHDDSDMNKDWYEMIAKGEAGSVAKKYDCSHLYHHPWELAHTTMEGTTNAKREGCKGHKTLCGCECDEIKCRRVCEGRNCEKCNQLARQIRDAENIWDRLIVRSPGKAWPME